MDKLDAFDQFLANQQIDNTGITTQKEQKFNDLATIVVRFARKARIWAVDNANATLIQLFDIHITDFRQSPEEQAVAKLKDVRDAINTNIASLTAYNVTAGDVTNIDAAFTAYSGTVGTPAAAQAATKAATEAIDTQMHLVDQSLEIIDDLLITEYETSNPDLVNEYRNDRLIDNIAVHPTTLEAHITGASANDASIHALFGVTMKIAELNKTVTSDIDGIARIRRFKAGTYHVEFSAAGYTTQTVLVKTSLGKTHHLDILLN